MSYKFIKYLLRYVCCDVGHTFKNGSVKMRWPTFRVQQFGYCCTDQ